MKYRDEIIRLHNEGKTRPEICKILGCDKSLVCYHLTKGQKEKVYKRNKKYRERNHPLIKKIDNFKTRKTRPKFKDNINIKKAIYDKIRQFNKKGKNMENESKFTFDDVIDKVGETPVCYLTGTPIDLLKPSTYHLDHIIPVSRGGDNSLDNMGLCTKEANMAKSDLTVEEFKLLCQKVCSHFSI